MRLLGSPRRLRLVAAAGAIGLTLVGAGSAHAATVQGANDTVSVVSDAVAENNDIALSVTGQVVTVREQSATAPALTVGPGCVATADPKVATCDMSASVTWRASVNLGPGDDRFRSTGLLEPLLVLGGPGNDDLGAEDGDIFNNVFGGDGDDRIVPGPGSANLSGGDGVDTLDYSARTAPLTADLDNGGRVESPRPAGGFTDDSVGQFEIVLAGSGDDQLRGTPLAETIDGGPGDDLIQGRGGDDTLRGDAGDDDFDGSATPDGNDTIDGGDGFDAVDYGARTAPVTVALATGTGGDPAAAETDALTSVEDAVGGSGADALTGSALSNALSGGPGDDTLLGGAGDDILDGEAGADDVAGQADDDTLFSRDAVADTTVDCGAGTDLLEADNALDPIVGCETIAPQFAGTPRIGGDAQVGLPLTLDDAALSGTAATTTTSWFGCPQPTDSPFCFSLADGVTTYTPVPDDEDSFIAAELTAANAAGDDVRDTAFVGPVAPVPDAPDAPEIPATPVLTPTPTTTPVVRPAAVLRPAFRRSGSPRTVRRGSRIAVTTGDVVSCVGTGPACRMTATMTSTAKRPAVLGRAHRSIPAGRTAAVGFTLGGRVAHELRRVGRLRVRLSVVVQRGTGRTARLNRVITLRAPRAA